MRSRSLGLSACRTEILEHFWCNLRGLFWWNRGVKRSLNNDLDFIPARALQAGGHRFDPRHVHQPNQCEDAWREHCGVRYLKGFTTATSKCAKSRSFRVATVRP